MAYARIHKVPPPTPKGRPPSNAAACWRMACARSHKVQPKPQPQGYQPSPQAAVPKTPPAAVGNTGLSEAQVEKDFAQQATDGGKGLSEAEPVKGPVQQSAGGNEGLSDAEVVKGPVQQALWQQVAGAEVVKGPVQQALWRAAGPVAAGPPALFAWPVPKTPPALWATALPSSASTTASFPTYRPWPKSLIQFIDKRRRLLEEE